MSHTDSCLNLLKKLGKRDKDGLIAFLSESVVVNHPAMPKAIIKNRDEFIELIDKFFKWAKEGKIDVLRTAEQNHTVWIERIDHWKIEEKWVAVPIVGIFDFKDDKIIHWDEYLDFGYMQQFKTRPDDLFHEGAGSRSPANEK